MKAILIRTGSVPVHLHSFPPASPRISLSSRTLSLHLDSSAAGGIRRALSHPDVSGLGSHSFSGDDWPEILIPVEEIGFPGGGVGKGKNSSRGGGRYQLPEGNFGGGGDRNKIGAYYQEMIRSNPTDSLLLANYAKFLHQVEGDKIKAGEYYARAILANPSDGEVLSLYGKLIWETERDGERAEAYFDRALHASPNDSAILGAYANFMWEVEENEDEALATLVEAF